MKNIFVCAALISFATITQGAPKNGPSLKIIKPIVLDYLNSTGCPYDKIDPKLVTNFSDKLNKIEGYITVAHSDPNCAGGSGTTYPQIIVLRTASGQEWRDDPNLKGQDLKNTDFTYLKVDLALSEPTAHSNLTDHLTSIYQNDGQLFATALSYKKGDANCCPSEKITYKITLIKKTVSLSKDDNRDFYSWNFSLVKN